MDSLTHLLVTRKFISKKPRHLVAGVAPDLPFYLSYPAWVASRGELRRSFATNEWPDSPQWMETLHHSFHSLPVLFCVAFLVRLLNGRWPKTFIFAWGLHILIDIPTHSRRRWGPRFLWPFSNYAVDGVSWAELAIAWLNKRADDQIISSHD